MFIDKRMKDYHLKFGVKKQIMLFLVVSLHSLAFLTFNFMSFINT